MNLLKTLSLVFCILSFISVGYAKKTFKVCNVTKGNKRFPSLELKRVSKPVEDAFRSNRPAEDAKRLEYEIGNANHHLIDPNLEFKNAFIATALTAYNHHLPLELSPDDIWTLVAYGVAQHIGGDAATAERYRDIFVNHKGKKELSVRGEPYGLNPQNPEANKNAWPGIIAALSELIKNNTKTSAAEIMTKPYTTTGPVEQTVFHCMLMDAMKNYFEYKVILACGIPDITLHGTIEDWRSIVNRINKLTEIFTDLDWYLNRIKFHVQKFVDIMAGNQTDLTWWNRMILDEVQGSGGDRMFTGWLAEFFPYRYHGQERYQNIGTNI